MTATTDELLERARTVTVSDRSAERPAPPAVFVSGSGAWCTDLDGREYLDLTASSGAVLLGHAYRPVVDAVVRAVSDGAVGLADAVSTPLVEVSERLVTRYPAADGVVYFRTGSEATTAAVRLARAATGRQLILSAGYHGWHDWQLGIQGINANCNHGIVQFGYHLDALRHLLSALSGQVAGVIVSPEPAWMSLESLSTMGEMCRSSDVPFILDEVMTGLRFGPSGINGSGVDADLIVLAKGLANGHSLAAVAGRRDLIDAYHAANIGGTYNREVAPLAAAREVLDATKSGAVHRSAGEVGRAIQSEIVAGLTRADIPVWTGGPPMMFDVVIPGNCAAVFYAEMFRLGVHMDRTGTQFVTAAHGEREIDLVGRASVSAAEIAARSCSSIDELDDQSLADFAWHAFGGVYGLDIDWRSDVERVVDLVKE